jgi:hypothetical protein
VLTLSSSIFDDLWLRQVSAPAPPWHPPLSHVIVALPLELHTGLLFVLVFENQHRVSISLLGFSLLLNYPPFSTPQVAGILGVYHHTWFGTSFISTQLLVKWYKAILTLTTLQTCVSNRRNKDKNENEGYVLDLAEMAWMKCIVFYANRKEVKIRSGEIFSFVLINKTSFFH